MSCPKESVLIFAHTEYHLIIAVNQILGIYKDQNRYEIELLIKTGEGKRLDDQLDFSALNINVSYFDKEVSIYKELSNEARIAIEVLKRKNPNEFIFFQEMDPLMVVLANYYSQHGAKVCLYQDGLKPYVNLKYHSLGLIIHEHKQNNWLRKNGFPVESFLSPLWSKKYGRLKSIDTLYFTFPESYSNWNEKNISKIELVSLGILNEMLKKIYKWDNEIVSVKEGVILYLSQPMNDDGLAERCFLNMLTNKFPERQLYIKIHPLTDEFRANQYRMIHRATIIKSRIPAELFIMNLRDSIILSVNSTSMFIDNPDNKFYYLYKLFSKDIKRLGRFELKNNPAPHILAVNSLDDIYL